MSTAAAHPMIHDFMGSWQQMPEVAARLAAAWRARRQRRTVRREYEELLSERTLLDDLGVTRDEVRARLDAC